MKSSFQDIFVLYEGSLENGSSDVRCGFCYERFELKYKSMEDPTFLDPTYCPHCQTEVYYPAFAEW